MADPCPATLEGTKSRPERCADLRLRILIGCWTDKGDGGFALGGIGVGRAGQALGLGVSA